MPKVQRVEERGTRGAREVLPQSLSTPAPLSSLELARLRQVNYRLFGSLFLYPDGDRLTELRTAADEIRREHVPWETLSFSDPLQRLLAALSEMGEEATGKTEEDFVRLFQAKSAAPPYESFYLEHEGQARALMAADLEREYAEAGLALSPSLMDLPDHIAVELEFMSFLCAGEVQAREADESEEDWAQARERQRAFLGRHLGQWFPRFARRVKAAAPNSLYDVVVEAAYAFLRYELGFLGLRRGGSAQGVKP